MTYTMYKRSLSCFMVLYNVKKEFFKYFDLFPKVLYYIQKKSFIYFNICFNAFYYIQKKSFIYFNICFNDLYYIQKKFCIYLTYMSLLRTMYKRRFSYFMLLYLILCIFQEFLFVKWNNELTFNGFWDFSGETLEYQFLLSYVWWSRKKRHLLI